ncbi:MAG: NAD(+) kinase [Pseudomonadales bacterium]|jgi:NAD+ kinase|nr:NAD(+) kinase [Pseudomonadales bacterium]
MQFSTIGIISRRDNRDIVDSLNVLTAFLQQQKGVDIVVDDNVSELLAPHSFRVCAREAMGELCELVIVVGGDGSMLKAAAVLAEQKLPVVGINRGRLGFLTDILPDAIEQSLGPILAGHYKVEGRFLLDVNLTRGGNTQFIGSAMNDIVLHPGIAAQMIEFELYIDGQYVYNQASDGLIVATPTGSTAYAMSAGGPIMHPGLDALVLVPMYPHSLSSRPIVVGSNSEIRVVVGERHNYSAPQISCDGSVEFTTQAGDVLTIVRKPRELRLLHPENYDYYATCRSKLMWSHRPGRN